MSPAENIVFAIGVGVMNAGLGAVAMITIAPHHPAWPAALVLGGLGMAWATMWPARSSQNREKK